MQPIHLDNLPIEVTRKPIRNLRMRVCPPDAAVRVSVPLHVTEAEVVRFVAEHAGWIHRHRSRILARREQSVPVRGEQGEQVVVWGCPRTLQLFPGGSGILSLTDDALQLAVPRPDDAGACLRHLREGLRKLLMQRMSGLADVWAPAMGVARPELHIRRMKTRWGTCNPSACRVWINAELVHRPPECLEYVMVHELAHLLERGHTDRFRAILDRHLPGWKACRQALNGA